MDESTEYQIALDRLRNKDDKNVTAQELRKRLTL